MSKFVGRNCGVGLGKESTRGTAVAPTQWIPWASLSFNDKVDRVLEEAAFGNIADADSSYTVKSWGEGEIEADIHENYLGLILAAIAGAAPSTSGTTNYVHTFTLQNINNKLSLSLAMHTPNNDIVFPFGMIDSYKIDVKPASIVKNTISFRSQKSKDWGVMTPSYTTLGDKYLSKHCEFRLATSDASYVTNLNSADKIAVTSLSFSVNNNLADWDTLGTVTPVDIVNRTFAVEGEVELAYDDQTYRNYVMDGTYKACRIKFNIGTNNYFQIDMPKVDFREWTPSIALSDIATQKFTFKALYDTANAVNQIGQLKLANQVISY
jgi:hypothetical protein